jgi:hypothetical protein
MAITLLAGCGADASATPSASPAASGPPAGESTATATPTAIASASASADAPAGWARVDGDGFSIAVPAEWRTVSAGDLADAGIFDEMRDANPEAAGVIDQAQSALESGQIALFAFDPGERTTESGFATNLNVIPVSDVGGSDIEQAAHDMAQAIELQIPVSGEIEVDTAELPAGNAAVVRYRWLIGLPTGTSIEAAVTQYLIVIGDNGYILTMTGIGEYVSQDAETWQQMATSFRQE